MQEMNGTPTTNGEHGTAHRSAPHGALRALWRATGVIFAFVAALVAGVLLAFVVAGAFGGDDPAPVDPIELGSVPSADG